MYSKSHEILASAVDPTFGSGDNDEEFAWLLEEGKLLMMTTFFAPSFPFCT